jgi:O-antigen biosynthesis protein
MATGIKVLMIGAGHELSGCEVRYLKHSSGLRAAIAEFQPDVIVTAEFIPSALNDEGLELRRRWIHVDPQVSAADLLRAVHGCYAFNLWSEHPVASAQPLVSVYTPTYNTGDYLVEAYQSLREQSYRNWEWIVVDDHSTDRTWERLEALARDDVRVRPFRSGKHVGKIGATKDFATRLATGSYLVELDHDDLLTDSALEEIVQAFQRHTDVGMVYSNCASFYENGSFQRFEGEFWQSRYRWTEYRGKKWLECINPDIYDRFGPEHNQQFAWFLTVGPHHVRAFRTSVFRELGGYNPRLPVADDWDLIARFFLQSRCWHIDKMLYLYRYRDNHENATFLRNQAIQDHLELGRAHYEEAFKIKNALSPARAPSPTESAPLGQLLLSDLSVIVLEAVPSPLTERCLASVREHAPGAELILVANGCEPSAACVALADSVERLPENVFFAAGCNAGAARASRRVLCFLNNDAYFVDDSPHRLLAALAEREELVGPYSNRAKPPQGDVETAPADDQYPQMIVGVCLLVTQRLFQRLGGFDPRLLTFEDDDLCARAADLGHASRVVGGTFVAHDGHATFRALGRNLDEVMADNQKKFAGLRPSLRVVAIAKNEAQSIRDFFRQFAPITRDFCLLDTGSTDDTVALALEAGARVERSDFVDFAATRNEALKRFGPGADWIVMLDPDERLDQATIRHLRDWLWETPHDVFLAPLEAVGSDGTRERFVSKPFLFRYSAQISWVFKVHEKLIGSSRQALVTNARIEHLLSLHEPERRAAAEQRYARLMNEEPYFRDPAYRRDMMTSWPILDYDRLDDPRLTKVEVGPLVSVIIPTYRRSALLQRAVRSALAQDYGALEILVVGDACPELRPNAFSNEPRVRVYNLQRNGGEGGASARNHALCLAAGQLVAYLDDDNAWESGHVSSLVKALERNRASFAFSSMKVEGRDLGFTEPKLRGIDTSCLLHRRSLIAKYGGWKDREQAGYAHDWELVQRWVEGAEPWAATRRATVLYNARSSGQAKFLEATLAGE